MKTDVAIFPFRWDVSRPSQLGSLIEIEDPKEYLFPPFYSDVVECCAKILARSDNGDLFFVGRSPDNFYDFLSGALKETSWRDRLHLLHFSFFYNYEANLLKKEPEALQSFYHYLTYLGLNPSSLIRRESPVVFVDLVSRGITFGRLINLLRNWCDKLKLPWERVKGKIRVVGIVRWEEVGGYYRARLRWQFQLRKQPQSIKTRRRLARRGKPKSNSPYGEWPKLLSPGAVRFFPADRIFWSYLADRQPKIAVSYRPDCWGKEWVTVPSRQPERLEGLKMALAFYQEGTSRTGRLRLVRDMSREEGMQYPWFRALLGELVSG